MKRAFPALLALLCATLALSLVDSTRPLLAKRTAWGAALVPKAGQTGRGRARTAVSKSALCASMPWSCSVSELMEHP